MNARLQRLDMKPGDKYVLTVDGHISMETAAHIRDTWNKFMGSDVPVLILDKGWKIGVISDPNYGTDSDRD